MKKHHKTTFVENNYFSTHFLIKINFLNDIEFKTLWYVSTITEYVFRFLKVHLKLIHTKMYETTPNFNLKPYIGRYNKSQCRN